MIIFFANTDKPDNGKTSWTDGYIPEDGKICLTDRYKPDKGKTSWTDGYKPDDGKHA